ncbi:MAG TPA: hypothetical protein VJT50_07030 [Pyrinomonadaceae bacterium]|nr:hypothetical protein [Pyrinomonadaceae bacterium]
MSRSNKRNPFLITLPFFLAVIALPAVLYRQAGTSGFAPPQDQQVEVIPASRIATSTDVLRGLPPAPVSLGGVREKKRIRLNPNVEVSLGPAGRDPVLQSSVAPRRARSRRVRRLRRETPAPGKSIEGIGFNFSGPQGSFAVHGAPPDTSGAVGDTQFVQWVNESFAVFNKNTGAVEVGPIPGNRLFQSLGGHCAAANDGDPVVQYDKMAKRWVLSQFAVSNGFSQCVAVSTTSDATGTYHLYEFTYPAFDDYPKVGVWPDGYYVTFNMFNSQDRFIGSRVCAYDRQKMLQGLAATQQCFQLPSSDFGLLPTDLDGATSALVDAQGNANGPAAPPAGAPNYILGLGGDSRSLNLWKFHIDWTTPANSTLGIGSTHRPNATIPVARFTFACNGSGQDCVPQPGAKNPEKLDTLGERLMFRLAYRRFADHESLVVSHSVDTGPPSARTAVRWYEIRNPNAAAPLVFQQSTYAPDTSHRWMGSIGMDRAGNLALGYSVASTGTFPSIRYATRGPSDPLNTLGGETRFHNGTGTQRCKLANGTCLCPLQDEDGNPVLDANGKVKCDTVGRWGDYSSITIDPNDDCQFWYTTEYQRETGAFNWHTRIGSFKLASCH